MRLTLINFFGGQRIPGHLFRGKKRLVEIVTRKSMNQQIREFELAEANMLLLRHPFLTLEQSSGHAKELQKTAKKIQFWNNNPIKQPLKPHVRIEDRLGHLKVKECWD